jgi:hypothetical protein
MCALSCYSFAILLPRLASGYKGFRCYQGWELVVETALTFINYFTARINVSSRRQGLITSKTVNDFIRARRHVGGFYSNQKRFFLL